MADVILTAVLLLLACAAVYSMVKNRKKGCCRGCSSCTQKSCCIPGADFKVTVLGDMSGGTGEKLVKSLKRYGKISLNERLNEIYIRQAYNADKERIVKTVEESGLKVANISQVNRIQ